MWNQNEITANRLEQSSRFVRIAFAKFRRALNFSQLSKSKCRIGRNTVEDFLEHRRVARRGRHPRIFVKGIGDRILIVDLRAVEIAQMLAKQTFAQAAGESADAHAFAVHRAASELRVVEQNGDFRVAIANKLRSLMFADPINTRESSTMTNLLCT